MSLTGSDSSASLLPSVVSAECSLRTSTQSAKDGGNCSTLASATCDESLSGKVVEAHTTALDPTPDPEARVGAMFGWLEQNFERCFPFSPYLEAKESSEYLKKVRVWETQLNRATNLCTARKKTWHLLSNDIGDPFKRCVTILAELNMPYHNTKSRPVYMARNSKQYLLDIETISQGLKSLTKEYMHELEDENGQLHQGMIRFLAHQTESPGQSRHSRN
jgi:hypothetical protein